MSYSLAPDGDEKMAKLAKFLKAAQDQVGDRYRFGAEARRDDADPNAFDSSELVEWAAKRAGIDDMPDGSWNQYRFLSQYGATVDVDEALLTPGALVFGFPSDPMASPNRPGRAYVAISVGDGKNVIDVSERAGEVKVMPAGDFYNYAAKIPDLHDTLPPAIPVDTDGDGVADSSLRTSFFPGQIDTNGDSIPDSSVADPSVLKPLPPGGHPSFKPDPPNFPPKPSDYRPGDSIYLPADDPVVPPPPDGRIIHQPRERTLHRARPGGDEPDPGGEPDPLGQVASNDGQPLAGETVSYPVTSSDVSAGSAGDAASTYSEPHADDPDADPLEAQRYEVAMAAAPAADATGVPVDGSHGDAAGASGSGPAGPGIDGADAPDPYAGTSVSSGSVAGGSGVVAADDGAGMSITSSYGDGGARDPYEDSPSSVPADPHADSSTDSSADV